MDHGDMDMGGDQCAMNVGQYYSPKDDYLTRADAFYLVFEESLHRLPSMARHRHPFAHPVLDRHHHPDSWVRMRERYQ